MHLLRTETRSLDEAEAAVDLAQTPADLVFLSLSDSDLAIVAAAAQSRPNRAMSLRLANIAQLKHPFSVDLYIEKVAAKARFVLVRLLGGLDYWRYGVEELARAARQENFALAVIPGDAMEDDRLGAASTLPASDLRAISACFQEGGPKNIAALLDWIEVASGEPLAGSEPRRIAAAGRFEAGCRPRAGAKGHALIVFYRSFLLADDTTPIEALAEALAARGLDVASIFVASLKDLEAIAFVRAEISRDRPDVILNTTAFSARLGDEHSVLEEADAPILQAILSGATKAQWEADPRGLGAADLAMNIVLPEMDGRLITRAIAFKAPAEPRQDLEFTPLKHCTAPSRVGFVADLAIAWVRLRKTPPGERKIACILSDYPGKSGRGGYAVGLDTAKSVASIAALLREAGYDIGSLPESDDLMRNLEAANAGARLSLAQYRVALSAMPPSFVESLRAQWGEPEQDALAASGAFSFPILSAQNFLVALQPDRGARDERKAQYHNAALAPRHSFVAFYVWLREIAKIDAMIHCGAHGTLEWLPGKATALGEACAPEAVLGALPVIYPFIVNNSGEAAQAKRRINALTIGHMTPPLTAAGSHGAALEIESLLDEYAAAEPLDPKRARLLAQAILDRARETGLAQDSGLQEGAGPTAALQHLDSWLCDLKDMRIADGLHVFGQSPDPALRDAAAASLIQAMREPSPETSAAEALEHILNRLVQSVRREYAQIFNTGAISDRSNDSIRSESALERISSLIDRCGPAECGNLLKALDGCFVAPGPGGAPSRGRLDVLPTGRNLYGVDPRAVPTRTAWEIGRRAAREVLNRHAQDHGEWPQRIVMDLWASATMRTGGDDLAQGFALLGVKPSWDHASSRVNGFEIIPPARLEHPRVDVTLRISGLFRDVFPAQIALFDSAVRAIAALEEDAGINPLAAEWRRTSEMPMRIFGAAPSTYGIGLSRRLDGGHTRSDLGALYLAATSHAYGGARGEGLATPGFRERVAAADAFVHVEDQDERDILDSDAIVDHVGGFAAAAHMLGNDAPLYQVDSARPDAIKARSLPEQIARVVRARASNPRWIKGQMRHGHRGGAEIAETVDHLFAFAALTDAVKSRHFELVFEATCATPEVRDFLIRANPKAALAIVERFEEALRRGYWRSRRNSSLDCLGGMREALTC
ncbi:cobaltochelatase subunit CobN [Methylocapsa aurea]|uniref:cobaltochelatase subunit CobN n=1 Tax=Methylocapsa aurea TaxID=663610 RepID=UPI00055AA1F6|nr:cobaltochelatase subunit CobN [Methylocapsa aurea]